MKQNNMDTPWVWFGYDLKEKAETTWTPTWPELTSRLHYAFGMKQYVKKKIRNSNVVKICYK